MAPAPLAAQTLYGCRDLSAAPTPSVEGRQGVFFRVDPDLLTYNRFSDEVVTAIGTLSHILAERGTTFIVVPVPTKALAMPQYLGPDSVAYGYDPALALAIYQDTLARLRAAGVKTVDARRALSTAVSGESVFFGADPRLTNTGLFALASGIADQLRDGPAPAEYRTDPTGTTILPSLDRLHLQMHCLTSLPEVTTMGFKTTRQPPEVTESAAPVIVAGTEMTGDPALNFAGFLSELSGREVTMGSVPHDPVAALSAYLTSDAFRQTPPDTLVWEVPVWLNLGLHGDQPFRELVAAARNDCVADLAVAPAGENRITVDLSGQPQEPALNLLFDTRATLPARAEFHFFSKTGQERTRPVVRAEGQPLTGRFYMPLTGLWPDGIAHVEIEAEVDPDDLPRVSLCRG